MRGRYRVIDEVSKSILGAFDSRGEAIDFVAAAMSVNTDDFLDDLTISNDAGPQLYGDSLRGALRDREADCQRAIAVRSSPGYGGGYSPPSEAMAAKGYPN